MLLSKVEIFEIPAVFDAHVHLRQDEMMHLIVPTIRDGGANTVYVMPNLIPPLVEVKSVLAYKAKLQDKESHVTFLMSLYLTSETTAETIMEAKRAGITGVKSYPAGVTTNSDGGIRGTDYSPYYPVFAQMEKEDMILNLHGECPSSGDITIMTAEQSFLPVLRELHSRFPRLRIILEHLSTAAAVEAVATCGETVAGTITAHHLSLIVDNWQGDPHCNCKPVAKLPSDRAALLRAATSGNPKFFFGSDSAPHHINAKRGGDKIAAGVFTQPYTTQLVADAFEKGVEMGILKDKDVTVEKFRDFMGEFGRKFYRITPERTETIKLRRKQGKILDVLENKDHSIAVVPFRRGEKTWSLSWI